MIIIRTDAQSNRKALAGALSELFHEKPRYCGAPTFAYEFGVGRLARDASLRLVPSLNETAAERLAAALAERGFSCAVETVCSESDCASSRIAVYLVLTGYIIPQVEMDIQGHFRTLFFGIRKCLRFFMHCCPSNSDSIHHTTGKYCQTIAKYANRKFFYFYFPACRSLSATRRALLWKR